MNKKVLLAGILAFAFTKGVCCYPDLYGPFESGAEPELFEVKGCVIKRVDFLEGERI